MHMITISVGQALLHLMKEYENDIEIRKDLEELYLVGANSEENTKKINTYLQDEKLKNYIVSKDPHVINEDPTRRYFETHLSEETLIDTLDDVDKEALQRHVNNLYNLIPEIEINKKPYIQDVIDGKYDQLTSSDYPYKDDITYAELEYAFSISRLLKDQEVILNTLQGLNPADPVVEQYERKLDHNEKLQNLIRCGYLGVIAAKTNALIPLNIYASDPKYKINYRSHQLKDSQQQKTTQTQNLGIIKGYMPLPRDDSALSEETFTYLKPSERSTYSLDETENPTWAKENFSLMVHPFSNSISGTMLTQLRAMAMFNPTPLTNSELMSQFESLEPGKEYDLNKLLGLFAKGKEDIDTNNPFNSEVFLKCFVSAMLLNSGGHTLHEFTAPLEIQKIKNALVDNDNLEMSKMFYWNNTDAYRRAIKQSVKYNERILQRAAIHESIPIVADSATPPEERLFHTQVSKEKKSTIFDETSKHNDIQSEFSHIKFDRITNLLHRMHTSKKRGPQVERIQTAVDTFLEAIQAQEPDTELRIHWSRMIEEIRAVQREVQSKNSPFNSRLESLCSSLLREFREISTPERRVRMTPQLQSQLSSGGLPKQTRANPKNVSEMEIDIDPDSTHDSKPKGTKK